MATVVGSRYPDLKDKLSQMEGGKVTNVIIELLKQGNTIIEDAIVKECNDGTSHKTTVRNGLPQAEFRSFYGGVKCSKSTYTQVTDATSMVEQYAEVDKSLADLEGDVNQFRLNESEGHLEAMNQIVQETIFYGNKNKNPKAFDGLATRYNKISDDDDETSIGNYVLDAGGTGTSLTSIWFVTWGERKTHLTYPKGSKAGITHQNLGEVTADDGEGGKFQAYRDHFKWDIGMAVRDYRANCRIANIDLTKLTSKDTYLIDLMIDAFSQIEDHIGGGKTIIYANKKVLAFLRKQVANKANVNLTLDNYEGKPTLNFYGLPIKNIKQILTTEEKVEKVAKAA